MSSSKLRKLRAKHKRQIATKINQETVSYNHTSGTLREEINTDY